MLGANMSSQQNTSNAMHRSGGPYGQSSSGLGPGKLVIALCRKPFDDVDDDFALGANEDENKK